MKKKGGRFCCFVLCEKGSISKTFNQDAIYTIKNSREWFCAVLAILISGLEFRLSFFLLLLHPDPKIEVWHFYVGV